MYGGSKQRRSTKIDGWYRYIICIFYTTSLLLFYTTVFHDLLSIKNLYVLKINFIYLQKKTRVFYYFSICESSFLLLSRQSSLSLNRL